MASFLLSLWKRSNNKGQLFILERTPKWRAAHEMFNWLIENEFLNLSLQSLALIALCGDAVYGKFSNILDGADFLLLVNFVSCKIL